MSVMIASTMDKRKKWEEPLHETISDEYKVFYVRVCTLSDRHIYDQVPMLKTAKDFNLKKKILSRQDYSSSLF